MTASGVLPRFAPLALALLIAGCASSPPPAEPVPSAPRVSPTSAEASASATDADLRFPDADEEFLPPPPPDPPVPPDSLADRLLVVAKDEARESIRLYNLIIVEAMKDRPDAQNRARQKVLEAALAAERAETLMRVRFALLGGIPNAAEGEMRQYASFLSAAADDLLEVDVIDGELLFDNLPELTEPLLDAMGRIPRVQGEDE